MSNKFFIGDGYEVLACETYRANAEARLNELRKDRTVDADALRIYESDPTALTTDSAGQKCWENPAEYAAFAAEYDAPKLEEASA